MNISPTLLALQAIYLINKHKEEESNEKENEEDEDDF